MKWIIGVTKYWNKIVGGIRNECGERECQSRDRWRHFCRGVEGSRSEGAGRQTYTLINRSSENQKLKHYLKKHISTRTYRG